MKRQVVCEKCKSLLEYDDRSVWLGNREREDIQCPVCKNIVDTVFTDLIPNVHVVKKGEVE